MAIESSVIFFPCKNIQKTHHFYHTIVGLPVAQIQNNGQLYIYDTGYGYIGFCQYDDGRLIPSGKKGMCISFNCPDEHAVDALFLQMTNKGAEVIAPPTRHKTFPVYSCFFRDPDDYCVEFQRILEGAELTGGRIK